LILYQGCQLGELRKIRIDVQALLETDIKRILKKQRAISAGNPCFKLRFSERCPVPVRHDLVDHPTDWPWSSARFYAGEEDVAPVMDPLVEFIGLG
jgi:hypothetical protein